jgi:hypothetical protein
MRICVDCVVEKRLGFEDDEFVHHVLELFCVLIFLWWREEWNFCF